MAKSLFRSTLIAVAFAATAATYAYAAGPATTAQTSKGDALVNDKGMTLYVFAKDTDGKSACNGKCAANWPPLTAADGSAASDGYSVIARDDGAKQWAYKGKPLYTWSKDTKPGDATGDGALNGAWRVAKP